MNTLPLYVSLFVCFFRPWYIKMCFSSPSVIVLSVDQHVHRMQTHWPLNSFSDAKVKGKQYFLIAFIPSLLLQVFFSAYIFNSNVMVKVATQPAENPIDVLSRKLHLGPGMGRDVPRLSLPGKLVFPR